MDEMMAARWMPMLPIDTDATLEEGDRDQRTPIWTPLSGLGHMSTHLRSVSRAIALTNRHAEDMAPKFYEASMAFFEAATSLSEATRHLSGVARHIAQCSREIQWALQEFPRGISACIMISMQLSNMNRKLSTASQGRTLPLELPERSFTCFMKLPPELRFRVWQAASKTEFGTTETGLWTASKESSHIMQETCDKGRNDYLNRGLTNKTHDFMYEPLDTYLSRNRKSQSRMRLDDFHLFVTAGSALTEAIVKGRTALDAVKYLLEVTPSLAEEYSDEGLQTIHQLRLTIQAMFDNGTV